METVQELTATKQCLNEEDCRSSPHSDNSSIPQSSNLSEFSFDKFPSRKRKKNQNYTQVSFERSDEPIDLTTIHNRTIHGELKINDSEAIESTSHYTRHPPPTSCSYNDFAQRQRKHKLIYTGDDKFLMVNVDNQLVSPVSFSTEKQYEVIRAAKSLFSKRTRTLYHWMYPNVSRQRIKQAVASSWESLNKAEKDFYVSQVLGRFGFSHTNLMINPQLDSIKELSPVMNSPQINRRILDRKRQMRTPANNISANSSRHSSFIDEYKAFSDRNRSRRGRPKVQKKVLSNTTEFKDDPELSLELEKFALKFNLNKM